MASITRNFHRFYKKFVFFSSIILVIWFFVFKDAHENNVAKMKRAMFYSHDVVLENHSENLVPKTKVYPILKNYERKDWHDYDFIAKEKTRVGPGERGKPFRLTDPQDIEENKILYKVEGLNALVSDRISVNRSIPDTRHPECKTTQYLKELPTVSVIIVFHNEYFSVLLRTVHSVYNRTPRELLHEILLVNDGSDRENLYGPLQKYVDENFDGRVKCINLKKRSGLIVARMEGSRQAGGDVLVFLDAHMEANVNWIPPLLEPIAIEPKTLTAPKNDNFRWDTFEYHSFNDDTRGVFDLSFRFRWLPRRPEDKLYPSKPAQLPVMMGGAFAIRKDYFFDLGGYDEGNKNL